MLGPSADIVLFPARLLPGQAGTVQPATPPLQSPNHRAKSPPRHAPFLWLRISGGRDVALPRLISAYLKLIKDPAEPAPNEVGGIPTQNHPPLPLKPPCFFLQPNAPLCGEEFPSFYASEWSAIQQPTGWSRPSGLR